MVERKKILTLLLALFVGVCGATFYYTDIAQGYDTAGLGYVGAAFVLVLGMFRYDVFASLEEAKDRIMRNMQTGVVVLDDAENVIYSNNVAAMLFPSLETNSEEMIERLEVAGKEKTVISHEENVYRVRKEESNDKRKGHVFIIPDITDSYRYTTRLETEIAEKKKELENVTMQSISAVANTIDAKDEYTKGHSNRVAKYAAILARKLGKDDVYINNLEYMALLHDIGKIGVPDSVLNKAGKLTDTEYNLLKQHTVIGSEILKDITMVDGVAYGAMYHHERYDGKGYPQGLKGEEIPYEARIIGICDAYDAMTSNRVYRKKLPMDVVLDELEKGKGTQFDPKLVTTFIGLVNNGEMVAGEQDADAAHTLIGESSQLLMSIIDRKHEQIKQDNDFDYLTGLYNRKACEREITEFLQNEGSGVLLLVDLDYFKHVNDTYGHLVGDQALKMAADCMKQAAPEDAIVGRQGGDEFVIFLKNMTKKEEIMSLAHKIRESFLEKTKEEHVIENCSFSIGISLPGTLDGGYVEMFGQADKALYYVKQAGRNDAYMYSRSNHADVIVSDTKQDIQQIADILRNSERYSGALPVKMQELNRIYEFTKNIADRYQYNLHIVLFSLKYKGKEDMLDALEGAMHSFRSAIEKSLRRVDISTRYGSSQMIVVLLDASDSGVQVAINKILQNYYRIQPEGLVDIDFDYVSLKE